MKNFLPFTLCLVGCLLLAFVGYNLWEQAVVPLGPSKAPLPKTVIIVPTSQVIDEFKLSPRATLYTYVVDGDKGEINFTTYGGLVSNLSKNPHLYYLDVDKEIILPLLNNTEQDKKLKPLVETIKQISPDPDTQARIAVSLVQHLNYSRDNATDWYYPYETLYRNKGVCADKSLLLVYLLNRLGYDTVLFNYPEHMAVGIKSLKNHSFYNTSYAFIETTQPTIITYTPDSYDGGFELTENTHIIYIKGQNKTFEANIEYQDASKLKQLEKIEKIVEGKRTLNSENYAEWLRITKKYDITTKV
jgi:hypothetical protein